MHTSTPFSLLERLRRPGDADAWRRFVDLYTPLLYYWVRRFGLRDEDAADLVQDVLATLVGRMPTFQYEPGKSFRSWLRTLTANRWRDLGRRKRLEPHPLGDAALAELPQADADDPFWETEYRTALVGRAMAVMRTEFAPSTWQACWKFVVEDKPAAAVAKELNLSENAVYVAKSRVLSRLRAELDGLLD